MLKDIKTQETFEIQLEENQFNRQLMQEVEIKLLGHNANEIFSYQDFQYEVTKISNNVVQSK